MTLGPRYSQDEDPPKLPPWYGKRFGDKTGSLARMREQDRRLDELMHSDVGWWALENDVVAYIEDHVRRNDLTLDVWKANSDYWMRRCLRERANFDRALADCLAVPDGHILAQHRSLGLAMRQRNEDLRAEWRDKLGLL